jgi:carbon-monoxide dehydrogenase large subunit
VGNGTGGSRSLYGAGSAVKMLVGVLIARSREHAAQALGQPEAALEFRARRLACGSTQLGLLAIWPTNWPRPARRTTSPDGLRGRIVTSGATFPNGCHVAEVEIDPATGVTEIIAYTPSTTWAMSCLATARAGSGPRRGDAGRRPGLRRTRGVRRRHRASC